MHSNTSSGKPLLNSASYSRNQAAYNSNYRGRSPDQRNSQKSSQKRYHRSHSRNTQYRNNYSRSNSNRPNCSFDTSSHSHSRNGHYSNDRSRNSNDRSRTIDIENNRTIETEAIQIIEINDIIVNHEIIQTTNQINKDLIITIIKIDHKKIHKIGIQTKTKDKETTLSHLIEITHVIQILKTSIEVINQNIRDK